MREMPPESLKQAVEARQGGMAAFVQAVPLRAMQGEQLVWSGTVHVFDLSGHPDGAFRAYAWSEDAENGRIFVLLHGGLILGPRDAVNAALSARDATAK
jgi:hypothetical protein